MFHSNVVLFYCSACTPLGNRGKYEGTRFRAVPKIGRKQYIFEAD